MDTSKLKQGEYYGYYDENGKWITGQNGPNPMSPTDQRLVDQWLENYSKPFSKNWFKAVGKDLLFVFGIKQNN
jgi:hypothetical protein